VPVEKTGLTCDPETCLTVVDEKPGNGGHHSRPDSKRREYEPELGHGSAHRSTAKETGTLVDLGGKGNQRLD